MYNEELDQLLQLGNPLLSAVKGDEEMAFRAKTMAFQHLRDQQMG